MPNPLEGILAVEIAAASAQRAEKETQTIESKPCSMKRRPAFMLSLLVTALLPSVVDARQLGCRTQKPTEVHAFTVEARWNKRVFTNRETALITLTVTRPAPEDPAGQGVPTNEAVSVPVEGATAWTTVLTDRYPYPYGYGRTNSEGKAKIKLPLELLKKPGPYDVTHNAEIWTNQNGCPDIHEWGHLMESPGLTIKD